MDALVERFRRAYSDPSLVVLEGFHAVKHAVRFGAVLLEVVHTGTLPTLIASLAPDLSLSAVEGDVASLSPRSVATGVIAIAQRPAWTVDGVLSSTSPVVLLEEPRHLGNVGACIRVAAAMDAGGVLVSGTIDPWHPEVVRGAAGLQFALPVASGSFSSARPLIALSPGGAPLASARISNDAVLAFGTEREGLSSQLLERADQVVSIPMRAGVSSLNLATAVAVTLYAWRAQE